MSATSELEDPFAATRACLEALVGFLDGNDAAALSHAELEDQIASRGREVQRLALQEHLDLRSRAECRVEVVDAEGVAHRAVEVDHRRQLETIFGQVSLSRLAYRHRGHQNLHLADATLNLPEERHSHGLRRLAAIEAARGSFEGAQGAIERATGQLVGKRQVESLASKAAFDVEEFYATRRREPAEEKDVVVVSFDGKGIVMRPDSLRPKTAQAAAGSRTKLETRLSKGEKPNRKRMAEVGAVCEVTPVIRRAADVLCSKSKSDGKPPEAPKAKNKWVTASVIDEAAEVVSKVFDEAERRDPAHQRTWLALVDGNNHQIDRAHHEAARRGIKLSVVVDFVHVLTYLWAAAWCFFNEGDPAAEAWVHERALSILEGHARDVAAGIRRRASAARLSKQKRKKADECARYLTNKAPYLEYQRALAEGWPIATGVIEGTCRFLVKDRMAVTGARWSVKGAEAVLKLRAVSANGDFTDYWKFHQQSELHRVHRSRYAEAIIPVAA
ncbi:MAG TPA: ISKra4 family transposase [Acidimicrobiales bacterium]|nr:ISKra4 family transposase [Acidimicrobiales bacterium]